MKELNGIHSETGDCGGVPTLFINGEAFPAAAYMTYLEEYNDYSGFADAGYRLFSVPVLFSGRWISSAEYYKPFNAGIFDIKGSPDFSTLDASIGRILSACPRAYIIPRVNVSMPVWWIDENPDCTDGTGKRELLFSEKFRITAAEMLTALIRHINKSGYRNHIAGYQLAGGNTEEWFHFDLNAGCCKNAEGAFYDYLKKHYPECEFSGLPNLSLIKTEGPYHNNEYLARYLEFANNAVAESICFLSSNAKRITGGNVVISVFYGYSLEVTSPLYGTHALKMILRCKDLDFISSPNSYIGIRDINADWTEMYPADSVRFHGKVCMQECDIRTHLTKLLSDCAPEYDEEKRMTAEIWRPSESKELTNEALKKSFSRQLIKGNGFWWFDMWGGWYDEPEIHKLMKQFFEIYASSLQKKNRSSRAEIAVFADESAYKYMTECGLRNAAFEGRRELGYIGAPYDYYDVSDFESVYKKYKALIFLSDCKTESFKKAFSLCKNNKIKHFSVSEKKYSFSADEIRRFCESEGVHIFLRSNDIIYINESYAAVHSVSAGKKEICLKNDYIYRELLSENGITGKGRVISAVMEKNETKLFELTGLT